VTAAVASLFAAAVALRGYLPGAEPGTREVAADDPLAGAVVVGLLAAALAVVVIAVLARLRTRGTSAPRVTARSDWLRGDRTRPSWRVALVAFGLILGWLLLSTFLARLVPGEGPAGVPAPPSVSQHTAEPAPAPRGSAAGVPLEPDTGSDVLDYFYGATVIFVLVVVSGALLTARLCHPAAVPASPAPASGDVRPEAGSETLARAAEVGLAEVGDPSRDPRRAIIACYAAMERQLSLLPDAAPRDFDTASEVLARAVDHHALAPDSATQLVDLFDEARFSPHVMGEDHRDAAVAVLTQVLDELRSHV
jgi:hypothetical protein